MAMRVSGLYSGMDTESIIADLVKVKQVKVDLKEKLVEIEYNEEIINKLLIVECIEEQGFEVEL